MRLKENLTNDFNEFFAKVYPTCVLKFLWHKCHPRTRKICFSFISRAVCKHTGCGEFKFFLYDELRTGKNVKVYVMQKGPLRHTGERYRRFIKGERRIQFNKELEAKTPTVMRLEKMSAVVKNILLSGNLNNVLEQRNIIKKMSSENIKSQDLHPDYITNLLMLREALTQTNSNKVFITTGINDWIKTSKVSRGVSTKF